MYTCTCNPPFGTFCEANASVGAMALGATLRAPTALPGRETISAKAFRLPATLPGYGRINPCDMLDVFFCKIRRKIVIYIILQFNLKIKMLDEVLGLSLGWRCSYDAPACLVLFWWMMRDEPVSTRVGGFAIHEGWPMLQIDNLSYRILMDKLPSQKQHAHVEMYTYPHYKSNKMLGPLSIIFTLRFSSKSLAQGGEPPSGHPGIFMRPNGGTFQ